MKRSTFKFFFTLHNYDNGSTRHVTVRAESVYCANRVIRANHAGYSVRQIERI